MLDVGSDLLRIASLALAAHDFEAMGQNLLRIGIELVEGDGDVAHINNEYPDAHVVITGGDCSQHERAVRDICARMHHRGRHQAQGKDLPGGRSCPWARPDPYPAVDGHADLSKLETDVGAAAKERREQCFKLAHRFIDNAKKSGGIGPTSRSWPACRPNEDTDVRVDIEVKYGRAFV